MEKALEGNKTLEKLTLTADPTLPKEFHCQFIFSNGQSTSSSEMRHFHPESYHCPIDGRLSMSVTCCVTQLDVVYSV